MARYMSYHPSDTRVISQMKNYKNDLTVAIVHTHFLQVVNGTVVGLD